MNRLLHTRRRVIMLGAAGVACTGILTAGVANAATGGPSGDNPAGVAAGKGKIAQAMKEIRQQLRSGATHGEVSVDTKKGPQTIGFERGTVAQSTSAGFQVTESSGTSESWVVGPKMKVRERGQKKAGGSATSTPTATVSNGESVVVVGLKTDNTHTARLVVVLPAKGTSPSTGGARTAPTAAVV